MLQKNSSKVLLIFIFLSSVVFASAQTKRKAAKRSVKKTAAVKPQVEETIKNSAKKNARPETQVETAAPNGEAVKTNSRAVSKIETKPVYFYEFSQPNFVVSQVFIEHDEIGKGKITFKKKDFGEPISDPIQLSTVTLEKIKTALQTLNFLDSTENYQYEKDYSHLGNMKFTVRKDGREREAKFNYTTNTDAKTLADEYRRIGQQFVWIFDIKLARENYPLETPGLMNTLDSLVKRNEISDPPQMIPFLQELSNDERLPLMARNHAARIIKAVEKQAEKK